MHLQAAFLFAQEIGKFFALTLIRAAIKKSVAGRLKVIYDPHIVQWQAGFL
jgi:hypothetical protein